MTFLKDTHNFDTLLGLVERYSPSGQEGAVVEFLVERMQALGFEQAFSDEAGNAVGIIGEGPRQAVLLGHIDTVPGEIAVRVEGDSLYGRGSVDAKGPLAALVDSAARLAPAPGCGDLALPGWQIIVIGAVDEERDSLGARHIVPCYHPEFAVIGEPSQWERVTLGYKGSAWAEVSLRQELAHTASQGHSACEAAFSAWGEIQAWAENFNAGRERVFERVIPTLRGLSSGEDGFEEWASLRVGARLPVGLPPPDWYRQLSQICPEAAILPSGFAIPAYQGEKNTPLVRAFISSIRAAGGRPSFVLKTGTADLNIAAPAWGCPALAYGPGDSSLDHTPGERLSLSEYARAVDVLERVLRRLVKPGDG